MSAKSFPLLSAAATGVLLLAACGAGAAPASAPAASKPAAAPPSSVSAAPAASAAASKPSAASAEAKPATSAAPAASGGLVDFNWAVAGLAPGVIPDWTLKDQGFDKKNGLNLNIVVAGSGTFALQQLQAGQVESVQAALSSVILGNSGGAQFRLIDSDTNKLGFYIVGGKDMTPDNAATKLKGGKIGISSFGSESEAASVLYLQHIGLTRDKDVAIIQTGSVGAAVAALLNGAITAAPLTAGDALTAQRSGYKVLYDMAEAPDWLFESNAVTLPYLSSQRDMVLRYEKAWAEGNYYARSHPDDTKKIIGRELKTTDSELIDTIFQRWSKLTPANLRPSEAGFKVELDHFINVRGVAVKTTSPADYVDFSILDELEKSNFLPGLRQKYGIS